MKFNADVCRARGWKPGTILLVANEESEAKFLITAIGEAQVLVRQIASRNYGFRWSRSANAREIIAPFEMEKMPCC